MANSLEKAVSKTMGVTKGAQATMHGLTGVFKKLMEEHGEVSALLKRLSGNSDPTARAELYPTIRQELLSHERAELSEVYPVLAELEATREIAQEHAEQAGELEHALRALDALDFHSAAWSNAFERLFNLVKQHVKAEEEDYFPVAQEALGEPEAKALEARYAAAKQAAIGRVVS